MADSYVRESLPSLADRHDVHRQMATLMALTSGAGASMSEMHKFSEVDLIDLLPANPRSRPWCSTEPSTRSSRCRAVASSRNWIPGAKLVELPGEDGLPWAGEASAVVDEIERFMTGEMLSTRAPERRIASVLFTDIVGSTDRAAALGTHVGESCWSDTTRR